MVQQVHILVGQFFAVHILNFVAKQTTVKADEVRLG